MDKQRQKKAKGSAALHRFDRLIWSLVLGLLLLNAAIPLLFKQSSTLQIFALLALNTTLCIFLAFKTQLGKDFFLYCKESWLELRKVHWPTRQETMQVTLFVVLAVIIMSIIMWSLDAALFKTLQWLIGNPEGI